MPAPAVIPAPVANIYVVAVKKLVVEFLMGELCVMLCIIAQLFHHLFGVA